MYDDCALLSEAVYVFMYFDLFYIQWQHLTDLRHLTQSRLVVNYLVVFGLK
jgi:hypothetical protein